MMGGKKKLDQTTTDTVIGEGTICEGKIISEASLRIEGHMEGDVECGGDVTVGENADINASITARDVTIAGRMRGNVTCKGKLTVLTSGQLLGNIDVKSIVILDGGVFQGTSQMKLPNTVELPLGSNVIDAKAHKQNKEAAAAAGNG